MKFRNVEFRWSKFNEKYELVKWYKNDIGGVNCYTLALFEKGKEGWEDGFFGRNIPLDECKETGEGV